MLTAATSGLSSTSRTVPLPPASTIFVCAAAGLGVLAQQQDRDRGSLAEFAFDLDRSAGLVREAMDLRQAEAGALADRLGREERIEDLAQDVGSDAGAGIRDADGDIVAGVRLARRTLVARRRS